ncbi:MAG TPA: host attachment protein [Verrucomicrobiales bacterium]|nr:host attachment protein [Verrucomicrobiales bacterium]
MRTFIVLADLGRVRAVQIKLASGLTEEKNHLHEVESAAFVHRESSLGDIVSDQAGRFSQGQIAGMAGGMSYGEEHELENEIEKNNIAIVAGRVDHLIAEAGYPPSILAAPKSILTRLAEELSDETLSAIQETVAADLTKASLKDLEKRFLH